MRGLVQGAFILAWEAVGMTATMDAAIRAIRLDVPKWQKCCLSISVSFDTPLIYLASSFGATR